MKKIYHIITLLALCFAVGCTDAIYDSSSTETGTMTTLPESMSTTLTVENKTTDFDLQSFSWGGNSWVYTITPGSSETIAVSAGTQRLYFSYYPKYGADPGKKLMECYVNEMITVRKDEKKVFTFTDST
jgi:hypothetical protein